MDILWNVIAGTLIIVGIAGCVLPLLPGPLLSFAGLLILQLKSESPFSNSFLLTWAIIVFVIMFLDYIIPIYGTKRFGGTKFGLWGCIAGLIVGFWFGPIGIIVGPFFGALIGEWVRNRNSDQALKAAIGSFVGFLLGTAIKLIATVIMLYYFISSL